MILYRTLEIGRGFFKVFVPILDPSLEMENMINAQGVERWLVAELSSRIWLPTFLS